MVAIFLLFLFLLFLFLLSAVQQLAYIDWPNQNTESIFLSVELICDYRQIGLTKKPQFTEEPCFNAKIYGLYYISRYI